LVAQFVRRRDEAAFAALLDRHGPMVLGVCRRVLRDPQDADDAFQATFLVFVRKAAALRRPGALGNWLYGVAYRIALQARAGAARWRALERHVEDMPAAEPVDEHIWAELRPLLDEEINRLPEKYRAPVVLCYLEGKTYAEAARVLGWAAGTVSGRLARAREKLRARLAVRGVTLSAAALAMTLGQKGTAAVPAALAQATLKGGLAAAAGGAAAGLVSAKAVALSQGALKVALAVKLKVLALVVAGGGLIGAGTWVVARGRPVVAAHLSHLHTERQLEDDVAKLQGAWQCVAVKENGRATAPADLSWSFDGNEIVVQTGGRKLRGTYQLSRYLVVHRMIEIAVPEAPGGAPVTFYGAYAFDNGGLSVCVNKSAERQPKTGRPNAENGDVRYDFRRQ
jgi:RNA polymerase sigma factor (sigma-70 family)